MPELHVDGVALHHVVQGDGPPLVLVHGSWSDHTTWAASVDALADAFRVVRYDRRGHSRSLHPPGPRTRRRRVRHEDDLAALIEAVGAPVHLAATSYGALIALGLAARRPDLVLRIAAHEPPAPELATAPEAASRTAEVLAGVRVVVAEIDAGRTRDAARRFVEEVALGEGAWDALPPALRDVFCANAATFAIEQRDPAWARVDHEALRVLGDRILLTQGDAGPRWLRLHTDALAHVLPGARTATIAGAGHAPQGTHPAAYADLVTRFLLEGVAPGTPREPDRVMA
jgi:pimeloyl-ACP methyl ester carboxylesterase